MKRVAKFFLAAGLCVCLLIIPAYAVEAPSGENPANSVLDSMDNSIGSDSSVSASSDSSSNAANTLNEEDDKKESIEDEKIPDGWDETKTYYFQNGQKVKGWLVTGGERYWLDASTGVLLKNAGPRLPLEDGPPT